MELAFQLLAVGVTLGLPVVPLPLPLFVSIL